MELIKQHRITASQTNSEGLPVVMVNYQIGVHLFYLFSNQAKLRDFLRIDLGLVAERDRFEHEDGLPRLVHKSLYIDILEARGVEPLSSKRSTQTSTCLSGGKV